MGPQVQDKEWAAFYLGQFLFAIMGPTLAMDEKPLQEKARRDWQTASEHVTAAAKPLVLKVDFDTLLNAKGPEAKHTTMGKLLSEITEEAEKRHGKPIADLVRLGNLTAACMAYEVKSKESSPIRLGFLAISSGLGIPESISSGFLDDPINNLETFSAISVQRAKDIVSEASKPYDSLEVKPGAFGITVDVKKVSQHISRWFRRRNRDG